VGIEEVVKQLLTSGEPARKKLPSGVSEWKKIFAEAKKQVD